MVSKWTDADLHALDRKYAREGVIPHQRPFRAAMDLLGGEFSFGFGGNPAVTTIMEAYRAHFPNGEETWPGLGIGITASVDQVRKLKVHVQFGAPGAIPIWESLAFDSKATWTAWCREDAVIAGESALAFADLHDFSHGLEAAIASSIGASHKTATERWHMASSNLSDVANILPSTFSVESVLQPICLTAELSLKAALYWLGQDPWGHKLTDLAASLADLKPHRDDTAIEAALEFFPHYVESRYRAEELIRYEVVRLALAAQFIAASSVRRLFSADLALVMESDTWPGPRKPFLPLG